MKGVFSFTLGLFLASFGNSQALYPKVVCTSAGQTLPDADDCQYYWVCSATLVPEHHLCPPGTYWDIYAANCNPPPVTCAGTGTPPTNVPTSPTGTTTPTTSANSNQYQCKFPSEIVPDYYDCEKYYICDSELILSIHYQCEIDNYYDPAYGACNFKGRVNCINGDRPSPFPTATPILGSPPPAEITSECSDPSSFPGLLIPDPTDCHYWWKCNQNQVPEKFTCPPELNFDHVAPMRCLDDKIAYCA